MAAIIREGRGPGVRPPAAVSDDAGEPGSTMGLHPKDLLHPRNPIAPHRRRGRRRRHRSPYLPLLRLFHRWLGALYFPHYIPIYLCVFSICFQFLASFLGILMFTKKFFLCFFLSSSSSSSSAVSSLLLSSEASGEFLASWIVHGVDKFCCWDDMRFY